MIVTKEQEKTFNTAIDEILSACYNLGLTKVKTTPKIKAGMVFTEEQSLFFKQIEDYAHSDLATVSNDLYHEARESPNPDPSLKRVGFSREEIEAMQGPNR